MSYGVWTWGFGIFGSELFLLSANYGTFDSLVDDGSFPKARYQALAAPLILGIVIIGVAVIWWTESIFYAFILVIMLFPSVPASYFSLKHLLLPVDDFGLLNGTRLCNKTQLVFFSATSINAAMLFFFTEIEVGIMEIFISVTLYFLIFSAIKGAAVWKT